jgi:hypothetical protein
MHARGEDMGSKLKEAQEVLKNYAPLMEITRMKPKEAEN